MRGSRRRAPGPSRRTFLKAAAAITAGTAMTQRQMWAQGPRVGAAAGSPSFPKIDRRFMITADQALEWHVFKSQCGPTYAGSVGWKRYTDFLIAKLPEYGGVDLEYVEIPYDHFIVDDWPDPRTHRYASGK